MTKIHDLFITLADKITAMKEANPAVNTSALKRGGSVKRDRYIFCGAEVGD